MANIPPIDKFKFFANMALPLVFDETLSYYETLNKVVYKLNEIINLANTQSQAIEDFETQITEFVTTWENNLKQELEEWKTDTEEDIDGWLNNAIDSITAWEEQFENEYALLKEEVEQIAEDADAAKTAAENSATAAAASANDANNYAESIRTSAEQITTNKNDIQNTRNTLSGVLNQTIYNVTAHDKYITLEGTTADINNPEDYTGYVYYLIPCNEGDTFSIRCRAGTPRPWGFIDNSTPNNILLKGNSTGVTLNYFITAPENSAYLIVNDLGGLSYVVKGERISDKIDASQIEIEKIKNGNPYFPITDTGKYISLAGNTTDINNPASYANYRYFLIPCNSGDKFSVTAQAGVPRPWGFVDNNNPANILLKGDSGLVQETVITAPSDSAYIVVNDLSGRGYVSKNISIAQTISNNKNDIATIKNNIENLQRSVGYPVPDYYVNHIAEKRSNILSNMMKVGVDGETFIFITDIHWDRNDKNSPSLTNYLLDNLNINYMINGGDLINEGNKDTMIESIRKCVTAFQHRNILMPIAFGNHDSNENFSPAQPEKKIDVNGQYALMQKQAQKMVTYFTNPTYEEGVAVQGNWNFYFDAEVTKTRFIIIDTRKNGEFVSWEELKDCILSTPENYNIVIIGHWLNSSTFHTKENLSLFCDGYNNRSSSIQFLTYDFDFSTAKGYVKLILGGHQHKNLNWYTNTGIPFVLIDSDNGPRSYNTDTPYVQNTITEQSFGVFTINYTTGQVMETKVGRGFNAIFNAGNVNVITTETLIPTIVPTYWESSDTNVATVNNGVVTAVSSGNCIIKCSNTDSEEYWNIIIN